MLLFDLGHERYKLEFSQFDCILISDENVKSKGVLNYDFSNYPVSTNQLSSIKQKANEYFEELYLLHDRLGRLESLYPRNIVFRRSLHQIGKSLSFIVENQISGYFLLSSPHSWYSYCMKIACEIAGVKINWLVQTLSYKLYFLYEHNLGYVPLNDDWDDNIFLDIAGQVASLNEWVANPEELSRINNISLWVKLWNSFFTIVPVEKSVSEYSVLFLHYQPERTTLPDAGKYYNQELFVNHVIAFLSSKGFRGTLLIKEHPSMINLRINPKWRRKSFYNRLGSLRNVSFTQRDTVELINGAQYVASCNGTVLYEAYLRGKSVICSGTQNALGELEDNQIDRLLDSRKIKGDSLLEYYKSYAISSKSNWNEDYFSRTVDNFLSERIIVAHRLLQEILYP